MTLVTFGGSVNHPTSHSGGFVRVAPADSAMCRGPKAAVLELLLSVGGRLQEAGTRGGEGRLWPAAPSGTLDEDVPLKATGRCVERRWRRQPVGAALSADHAGRHQGSLLELTLIR